MADKGLEEIVGSIFEAAFVPQTWPDVLDKLSTLAGCHGGEIFIANRLKTFSWMASKGTVELTAEYLEQGWDQHNTRIKRGIALNRHSFITDLDIFTQQELDNDPSYVDFLRLKGAGWGTGTHMPFEEGDFVVYSFERAYKAGPVPTDGVSLLNSVRPHLARAARIAAKLGLQQSSTALRALQYVGFPAAALSRQGKVLLNNHEFELNRNVRTVFSRLRLTNSRSQQSIDDVISNLYRLTAPKSISVPGTSISSPFIAHFVPVHGQMQDLFNFTKAIFIVEQYRQPKSLDHDHLQRMFNLTKAEASIAAGLRRGLSIPELAESHNAATETIRSHVKSIFSKTGTQRQAQLAQLLTSFRIGSSEE